MKRGQTVNVAELQPHPMNYNQHPEHQIKELRASLSKFGQVRDIIIWRQYVVAGHGVLLAARAEGWTEISATRLPDDWAEERVIAYLAADNETARLSLPDDEQLAVLLTAVSDDELRALAAGGEERLMALVAEILDSDEKDLPKKTEHIAPKKMVRVLISVPFDFAIDAKERIDSVLEIPGCEVIYGAN